MQEVVRKELTIKSKISSLNKVRKVMIELLKSSTLKKIEQYKVILAVDEAVTNVIEHAYEYNPRNTVELFVEVDDKKFQVIIKDSGKTFEPDKIKDPDIEEFIRQEKRKGLGMFLMRKIMDEVQYTFRPGEKNELKMVKYAI